MIFCPYLSKMKSCDKKVSFVDLWPGQSHWTLCSGKDPAFDLVLCYGHFEILNNFIFDVLQVTSNEMENVQREKIYTICVSALPSGPIPIEHLWYPMTHEAGGLNDSRKIKNKYVVLVKCACMEKWHKKNSAQYQSTCLACTKP